MYLSRLVELLILDDNEQLMLLRPLELSIPLSRLVLESFRIDFRVNVLGMR